MTREQVMITNKLGLHARAAAKLVHAASEFESEIFVGHLTTFEPENHAKLESMSKKIFGPGQLDHIIVRINIDAKLDLFVPLFRLLAFL